MKTISTSEVRDMFGIAPEQHDAWERDAADGVLHGTPRGEVVTGRPLLFGEETRQVGFREPVSRIEEIDRRARQLGMRRSEYLRHLVDADFTVAGA